MAVPSNGLHGFFKLVPQSCGSDKNLQGKPGWWLTKSSGATILSGTGETT
jgi:hypothetical protein